MAGEKTEKASPKKRGDERKKGNIAISQDIVSSVVLLSIFGMFQAFGQQYMTSIAGCMKMFFGSLGQNISSYEDIRHKFAIVIIISAGVLAPLFIINIVVSVVATMAQTKLLVSPSRLKPSLSKLNPISGIKNLFSAKSFVETLKSIIKMVVVGCIIFNEVQGKLPQLLNIYNADIGTSVAWTAQILLDVCFKAAEVFLIIGVIDYFYQWWDYERRIKMSKEDLKEEYKQSEGNPEIKGAIKSKQRELSRKRMMQAVPKADVVIRNPTHYAIALKYERDRANAPIVVAKGQNNVALKIVEIAMASNVYIIENRPLAQALYKTVEIGDEIPEEFYKAVAEVLAHIYKLKKAGRS